MSGNDWYSGKGDRADDWHRIPLKILCEVLTPAFLLAFKVKREEDTILFNCFISYFFTGSCYLFILQSVTIIEPFFKPRPAYER